MILWNSRGESMYGMGWNGKASLLVLANREREPKALTGRI